MNDDRPIEKLLRRYAKKRRDATGPPVTLHPATRRLLQGEVARQFRKAAPGGVPALLAQIFRGWRAQLAWAVPLFALVAIGLWSLLDRPAKKQLALGPALNQTTPADRSRASTAAETAPDDLNAVKATLPPPVSVPVRALNQPAPGLADPGRARENRDAEQALAFGAAPSQPIVSLAGVAEKKSELAHYGFKEVQRVDKLGVASAAAPAT